MLNAGEVHGTISLSDFLTPQLAKAEKHLESFAKSLTGIDTPLARLGDSMKQQSSSASKLIESLQLEVKHLAGLTAAYGVSETAVKRYNTLIEIETALARANVSATSEQGIAITKLIQQRQSLTDSLNREIEAQGRAGVVLKKWTQDGRDLVIQLEREVKQLVGLAAAYGQGAEAVKRYNLEQRIENELTRVGLTLDSEQAGKIRALMTARQTLTEQIQREDAALKNVTKSKTTLFEKINSLRFGYFALSAAIGISISSFIDAQRVLERMQNTFLAATGSMSGAAREMSFVREQANKLGLDFRSTGQEYAKFAAATKGTALEGEAARKIFIAVSTASTAMGLSAEQSAGALNALQQMVSKATVQSEELRGQLSERIPGSFAAAAKAMGMTEVAFNKQIEKGNILAKDLLPRLAEAWMETFSPAAAKGATLLNAEINRLKTTLFDFLSTTSQSTDVASLAREMSNLAETFSDITKSEEGTSSALRNIGATLSSLLGIVDDVAKSFNALLNIFQGSNTGTGMKGPLESISGITGAIHQILRSFVTNNDELIARSSQSAKDAAQVEFQRVMNLTNNQALAYDAGIRVLQQKMEEANARLEKSAQGRGPQKGRKIDPMDAQATAIRLSFERGKKAMDEMLDGWGDNEKAAKAYDSRLAHLLKTADPFGEITRDLAADMKSLNEMYRDGSITNYASAQKTLNDTATKARVALFNQTAEGKKWKKQLQEMHAEERKAEQAKKDAAKATKEYQDAQMKLGLETKRNIDLMKMDLDGQRKLDAARYQGIDALLAVNRELFIQDQILRNIPENLTKGTKEYEDYVAQITALAGAMFDLNNRDTKSEKMVQDWGEVASIVGEFNGTLGKVINNMAKLVAGVEKIKTAAGNAGRAFEGWASVITAGVGMLKDAGIIAGPGGGTGAMGGAMSGTYSAEGAAIGAVIGAIVGTIAYGQTAAGAAIGSAMGEVLGSMIKKGADEGLVSIYNAGRDASSKFVVAITGANNKLGRNLQDAATQMIENVQDIVSSLGAELQSIADISFKVRDDKISVFVNGIKKTFKEMSEAMSFAMTELLRTAETINMDPLFKSVLRNSSAQDLEALKADLDAISKIISFGFTPSQNSIRAFEAELAALQNTLIRTVTDTGELARGLANLGMEEARRWQSARDAITGEKRSNAEKLAMLKQDAEMWNAEKAMRVADLQMKALETESRLARLQADAAMVKAGNQLWNAKYEFDKSKLDAEARLLGVQNDIYQQDLNARGAYVEAQAALLQVQLDAIRNLVGVLQNMPNIDVPNLHLPDVGNGAGNHNNGPTDEERAAEEAAQRLADLLKQLAIDLGHAYRAGNEWATALYDLELAMADQIAAANGDAEALRQINELFELQFQQLLTDAVNSLGLASQDTINQFTRLANTLEFLAKNGRLTEEMMRELSDQMFIGLADGLLQYVDNEEARMFLEDLRFRMEIANYKLQFQMMKAILKLTATEIAIIEGLFAQIDAAYAAGELDFQQPNIPDNSSNSQSAREARANQALLNALERLRRALDSYKDFLSNLHTTALGGNTLQQQTDAALQQLMQMIADAQGGSLDAIEGLPGMAQHFLELAGQLYDPASSGYQAFVDMIEQAMLGIGLNMEDVLNQVPATMDDAVEELHTIAEILTAIANGGLNPGGGDGGGSNGHSYGEPHPNGYVYYGPEYGWHPMGWSPGGHLPYPVHPPTPPPPPDPSPTPDPPKPPPKSMASAMSTGYQTDIVGSPSISSSGKTLEVMSPQFAEMNARLQNIERRLMTQNDLTMDQTTKLEKKIGLVSTLSNQKGYTGPVRGSIG